MRGADNKQEKLFSYISPEERVPKDHPLRPIREMAEEALERLNGKFSEIYSRTGRPSIAPERLLKALLLQVLYSIRSERLLIEQLDYNLLFRWFVGLSIDEPVWDHSTFSKNRERLIESEIAEEFLDAIILKAEGHGLLSDEHFSVDGTLIEAWASMKSFRVKGEGRSGGGKGGRNEEIDFRGQRRSNKTHESGTDPDARLYRKGKGKEAKLYYGGHVLMENRSGLALRGKVTVIEGAYESEAALDMIEGISGGKRVTVGADKGYDRKDFVKGARRLNVTPHVNQRKIGSAIDGRTTRHEGYKLSQRVRKRVEEIFAWVKSIGQLGKVKYRGVKKVDWIFVFALCAYNLVRMKNLIYESSP